MYDKVVDVPRLLSRVPPDGERHHENRRVEDPQHFAERAVRSMLPPRPEPVG